MNDVYILALMSAFFLAGMVFYVWLTGRQQIAASEVLRGARPGNAHGFRLSTRSRFTIFFAYLVPLQLLLTIFYIPQGFAFLEMATYAEGEGVRTLGRLFAYVSFVAGATGVLATYYMYDVFRQIKADLRGTLLSDAGPTRRASP